MTSYIDYKLASTQQIITDLGERLSKQRLSQNLSQSELAKLSGVGERTLRRLEAGHGCSLENLTRILQVLGLQDSLQALVPAPGIGPAERVARAVAEPRRAGRKRKQESSSSWHWDEDLTP